ncbi:MAG: LacI family DNA-binding transcriptional regulator [Bacteroidetes bacterium]|nr:LacI family DNA-binding transcriptional regulator [Bacteroidota bacterium]MBS1929565.1 LacI family DNA-binding transcriptional regulator [Bacteroidota bacterium]
MSQKVTITDIARELNITPATVSRALSNHPGISDKTKQSVQQAASKLNYKKNSVASSLRSGKTRLIGVIIPSAEINFFGSVIHGIEKAASSKGYNIILYQSNESREHEEKGMQTFLSARVDGILVSPAKNNTSCAHFYEITERNIPIILFDRTINDIATDSVVVDDYKGAFMATEHLIVQGYQRIAHISGPQHLKNFYDRQRGYLGALQAHKIKADSSLIVNGNISIESGKDGARKLLSIAAPPDAVFAAEDYTALGVISELKEQKIRLPAEFGVVGFANELFGQHITPTLSTVEQQTIRMGESALELLVARIESKKLPVPEQQKIVLEPLLICRESSAGKR